MQNPYDTDKEIYFINTLGIWAQGQHRLSRRELVQRYLDSTQRRSDWGEIDSKRVIQHAFLVLGRM